MTVDHTSRFASLPVATRIKTVMVMVVMMIVPAIARYDDHSAIFIRRIPIARIESVVVVMMMVMVMVMVIIVLNQLNVGF